MNNLKQTDFYVKVQDAAIQFIGKEEILEEAKIFLEKIKTVEVNEENLQMSKKGVAAIRKKSEAIENERKKIKNQILEPYKVFESEVKEITKVINEADEFVRSQIRVLEEQKRERKKQEIEKIFNLRAQHYDFHFINFNHFFKNEYLNQVMTINKVETKMVEWFEQVQKDLKVIKGMENNLEIMNEYEKTLNLVDAITIVKERYTSIQNIRKSIPVSEDTTKVVTFKFKDELDYTMAVMAINQRRIEFEIV